MKILYELKHETRVNKGVFSPDGKKIITISKNNTAYIWNTQTKKLITKIKSTDNEFTNAVFSLNGDKVPLNVCCTNPRLYSANSGKQLPDTNSYLLHLV